MKELSEIQTFAVKIHKDVEELVAQKAQGWGDLVDQLRVLGYLGETMMRLAEEELRYIKLQQEAEAPKIRVYQ